MAHSLPRNCILYGTSGTLFIGARGAGENTCKEKQKVYNVTSNATYYMLDQLKFLFGIRAESEVDRTA